MKLPPDITLPNDWPIVIEHDRRSKRRRRFLLQLFSLLKRESCEARAARLAAFEAAWDLRERESLAFRLALHEFGYSRGRSPTAAVCAGLSIILLKDPARRARYYEWYGAEIENLENSYREKLGLPPVHIPLEPHP